MTMAVFAVVSLPASSRGMINLVSVGYGTIALRLLLVYLLPLLTLGL